MGSSETFDHTADLGLRLFGADLDDLFRTAAESLFDVIVANREMVQVAETEPVSLVAESLEDLLVLWLNELIFRCETRHRLYRAGSTSRSTKQAAVLEATIGGEPIDRTRHLLDHEVKAATRHGLSLRREETRWVAEVILDI